jgi:ABC-type transport system involved in multi-copper enzyme maturation permease subunit
MSVPVELAAAARLDLAEVLRSRWILFLGLVYAGLAATFVLLGARESALLGFTGTGRALLSFSHALILILPLLALTATGQVVSRARDDGSLELLFSQPLSRGAWLAAVAGVRYLVLVAPLALLVVAAALVGELAFGQPVPWDYVGQSLSVCASLAFAFTGIGLSISTFVRNPARATVLIILVWSLGVALLDFGLIAAMLRWGLSPRAIFVLAALNPVEGARLALLAGIEPDLATLGPVGFYFANHLGPELLFAAGVGWPAALGLVSIAAAWLGFRRGDVV